MKLIKLIQSNLQTNTTQQIPNKTQHNLSYLHKHKHKHKHKQKRKKENKKAKTQECYPSNNQHLTIKFPTLK